MYWTCITHIERRNLYVCNSWYELYENDFIRIKKIPGCADCRWSSQLQVSKEAFRLSTHWARPSQASTSNKNVIDKDLEETESPQHVIIIIIIIILVVVVVVVVVVLVLVLVVVVVIIYLHSWYQNKSSSCVKLLEILTLADLRLSSKQSPGRLLNLLSSELLASPACKAQETWPKLLNKTLTRHDQTTKVTQPYWHTCFHHTTIKHQFMYSRFPTRQISVFYILLTWVSNSCYSILCKHITRSSGITAWTCRQSRARIHLEKNNEDNFAK